MSQQGPILVVSTATQPSFASALEIIRLFPVVEVEWADAARAVEQVQPFGCGAVLFRDPSVGRFYQHDSPYTYFTSDELHLGEISLECSRAGAAAAALWLTFRLLPPTPADGHDTTHSYRTIPRQWPNWY